MILCLLFFPLNITLSNYKEINAITEISFTAAFFEIPLAAYPVSLRAHPVSFHRPGHRIPNFHSHRYD